VIFTAPLGVSRRGRDGYQRNGFLDGGTP
jgi:hypothetical protein